MSHPIELSKFEKAQIFAGKHPFLWMLIALPFWPITAVMGIVFGMIATFKRDNDLFMGLDFAIGIWIILTGVLFPFIGFMAREKH